VGRCVEGDNDVCGDCRQANNSHKDTNCIARSLIELGDHLLTQNERTNATRTLDQRKLFGCQRAHAMNPLELAFSIIRSRKLLKVKQSALVIRNVLHQRQQLDDQTLVCFDVREDLLMIRDLPDPTTSPQYALRERKPLLLPHIHEAARHEPRNGASKQVPLHTKWSFHEHSRALSANEPI
jgi:hypothetical protein